MKRKASAGGVDVGLPKQDRAVLTRRQLLRAARAVFARDGFEHARVEDIAARAGKTRGAFYDHFKDKEDVFFAIFEENVDRDMSRLAALITRRTSSERRLEIVADFLRELTRDRERILLGVEFKLYSVRHPRKRRRLATLHNAMRRRGSIPEINLLLPETKGKHSHPYSNDSLAVCGMFEGLALSHIFSPETFGNDELTRHLELCVRQMVGDNSEKHKK